MGKGGASGSESGSGSDEPLEQTAFETADAGASHTFPMTASAVRKGGYMVIKGRPCKVVDVSTSKTGKHGHAKCHFVALDIFTSRKMEELVPSSHNLEVPHVSRQDYSLLDISDDGFVSLMDDAGNTKDDMKLPTEDDLAKEIKTGFDEGKELVVTVLKAMGEEAIHAVKEGNK